METGNFVRTDNRGKTARTYTYLSPFGRETYQILLQEDAGAWIARIVTLPNKLWAHPNGREALKFVAATAEEAESEALQAMESECTRTGKRLASNLMLGHGSALGLEDEAIVLPKAEAATRLARRLLVRFGEEAPEISAITGNLSETGLFIISDRPARLGSRLRIDLRFPEGAIELAGEVVWTRDERVEGRSLGFAVRLTDRPEEYLARVRALA